MSVAPSPSGKYKRATLPMIVGFTALIILVGGLGVWSVYTRLAGAVVASGLIELESNRQVIQHPEGGVVGEILAQDGETVEAGQFFPVLMTTYSAQSWQLLMDS